MINANREVVIKDKEFITSTETSSTIIITRDQVWPRVSIPCFYRHPPHVLYFVSMLVTYSRCRYSHYDTCLCTLTYRSILMRSATNASTQSVQGATPAHSPRKLFKTQKTQQNIVEKRTYQCSNFRLT